MNHETKGRGTKELETTPWSVQYGGVAVAVKKPQQICEVQNEREHAVAEKHQEMPDSHARLPLYGLPKHRAYFTVLAHSETTQKNTSISQNERRHTTTSGAGKIITPLCFACGQQEETLEHLRYVCEHRRYETETQQVCEEWKVVFAGWKDVPDAVMQYGIALAKETAAGRQREKGTNKPSTSRRIQKHGGLGNPR